MKQFIIAIFALLLTTGLMAQTDKTPQEQAEFRAERMIKYLDQKLEFDEAQRKDVYDLQLGVQKQFIALEPLKEEKPEQFMEKQIALAKDTDVKILALLNDSQKKIYQDMLDRRRSR